MVTEDPKPALLPYSVLLTTALNLGQCPQKEHKVTLFKLLCLNLRVISLSLSLFFISSFYLNSSELTSGVILVSEVEFSDSPLTYTTFSRFPIVESLMDCLFFFNVNLLSRKIFPELQIYLFFACLFVYIPFIQNYKVL